KDIIIRGGENISCLEVEAAAYEHEAISETCVFGVADARFGEVPGIVYRSKPGTDVEPDALREHLAGRLAAFKLPVYFWPSAEKLPRLGTEKIDRNMLRRLHAPPARNG